MSLATFSQTGTTKSNLICFPDTVAKKIAIDLVRGDSAKAELIKTKLLVIQLENKDLANQKLVGFYTDKCGNYETQINMYKQKESKYINIVTGLESDVKKERKKLKIYKFATIGLGAATIGAFITSFAN
jgi:hypothetical protein